MQEAMWACGVSGWPASSPARAAQAFLQQLHALLPKHSRFSQQVHALPFQAQHSTAEQAQQAALTVHNFPRVEVHQSARHIQRNLRERVAGRGACLLFVAMCYGARAGRPLKAADRRAMTGCSCRTAATPLSQEQKQGPPSCHACTKSRCEL